MANIISMLSCFTYIHSVCTRIETLKPSFRFQDKYTCLTADRLAHFTYPLQ